ncbi:hypothetical protein Vretimale_15722 [Volvox reticuliferus]|uniref:RING-type domain-containing protein n=1 Tax=Volvox reticuliferus TaxID=1737510 RepID=A0A8J4LWM1_9CHLO|nr:hypothetical protein Vretifemale_18346 [Volvox reticuliferus]GIM12388.1 hypothetical protein Vretimale_15722 [Volvox reticuliferus]
MTHSAAGMKALMKYIPRDMLTWDSCRYVDTCSDCGLTAMHYCVFSNNLEALRELLYVHHLDVNAATKNQSYDDLWVLEAASTPLHFAAARGSLAAAVELLRYYDQRVVEDPLIEDPRTRVDALGQTPYQLVMLIHPSHRELSALLQPNQPLRAALRTALMTCGAELIRGPPPLVALAAEVLRHKLLKDVRCSVAAVAASAPSKPEAAVSPDPLEGPRFLRVSSLVSPALACSSSSTDRPDSSTDGGGADANKSPKMLSGVACVSGTHPGHNRTVPRLPHSTTDANAGISVSERCTGAAGPMKLSPVGGCGTSQGEEGVVRCVGSGTGGSAGSGFYRASSPGFRVVRDSAWDDGEEDHEGEGVQCGVCLEVPMTVMPASCGHGICGGCAEQLCAGLQNKPLPCPFCRRLVSAFVPWQRARFKTQSFWGP